MMPVMREAGNRRRAHLLAFHTYAAHARDLARYAGYTAIHAMAQREAVTDWLYCRYQHVLLTDALANDKAA
jgi:hypothetical protein